MADENGTPPDQEPAGESMLPLSFEGGAQGIVTPDDVAVFQHRLGRLLERRAAIYTMGDSTSVPMHVAADLLRSVCFVLGIDPDRPEVPQSLLSIDLEGEYRRRLDDIGRKVQAAEKLWRDVCATMPLIENIALRDTLEAIASFFKHYDYRSMAHDIPCSIDYPLCHPVPDSLLGVDYIAEYLRRLRIEAEFLRCFEIEACERVLASSCPDHVGLLINLYEPIAANAAGRALIGRRPAALRITDDDRAEIVRRLGPLGEAKRERALREAGVAACKALGMHAEDSVEYLCEMVPELLPRIEVGLAHGELRGVFVG